MDVCSFIKMRLHDLGMEQKDLAAAAQVTESYISQLLSRKKLPPAPDRTDIYEKLGLALKLSNGELAKLAVAERVEALKRSYEEPQGALLKDTRRLILQKCVAARRKHVRSVFEQQPFGVLERLVTQSLLNIVIRVARSELDNPAWLQEVAKLGGKTYEQMRVIVLEFLDTDLYNVSNEDGVAFLDPLIAHWDVDMSTFELEITLNDCLVPGETIRFEFNESYETSTDDDEPGLTEFLNDAILGADVCAEELRFLRQLSFGARRPNRLLYYRVLQTLRDPLHYMAEGN
jgi:transcriptional regulator with XRE-family HTH domain